MNPNHNCIQKISPETIFHSEIKGHNSDNNWWILSIIELDLYFTIIYQCMKYESNTPMFSKETILVRTGQDVRTRVMLHVYMPPIINGGGIKKLILP